MKKILIPIDESKEKPPEKNKQISISVRRVSDLKEVEYDFHYKEWFEKSSSHYQVIVKYWYKEVNIDELYLPGEVEQKIFAHFKDNHDVLLMDDDFNCLQNIIINYIKQKLEG